MTKPGKETLVFIHQSRKELFILKVTHLRVYAGRESSFFDLAVCVSELVHGSQVVFLLAR